MYGRKITDVTAEELHALIVDAMEKAMETAIKAAYEEGYKTALNEALNNSAENNGGRVEIYTEYLFDKISKNMSYPDTMNLAKEIKYMFNTDDIRTMMSIITKNKSKLNDTFNLDYNYSSLMKLLMK